MAKTSGWPELIKGIEPELGTAVTEEKPEAGGEGGVDSLLLWAAVRRFRFSCLSFWLLCCKKRM